jgi:ActR/RegA family two-component response regulator
MQALLQELSTQFTGGDEAPETTNLGKVRTVAASGKQEVLVIDEDQKDLESLKKMVEENDFNFRSARSFAGTLSELERRMPEGMILEIPIA